jgi:type III pantothenate kinase
MIVLLAVDARNRLLSIGFRSGGEWLARRRIAASPRRSADEYALLLRAFAAGANLDKLGDTVRGGGGAAGGRGDGAVDSAWISSVVPSLTREIRAAIDSAFGLPCTVVGPGVRTGLRIRTDVPSELGSDLVCQAVAARELVGAKACVVVSFDAAMAFSAIGRGGDFHGVAIAPGIGTALESFHERAALLPEVPLEGAIAALGKNTGQSIRAGMSIGYAGLVGSLVNAQAEELVALGEAESPDAVEVVGTGEEEGRAILAAIGRGRFVSDLALDGIALLAAKSAAAPKS